MEASITSASRLGRCSSFCSGQIGSYSRIPTCTLLATLPRGFQSISPTHSFMRLCEGTHRIYQNKLPGKNIRIGNQVLTGHEPMWNSGIVASLASIGKTSAPWWTPSLRLRQFAKSPIHGHQSSFALGLLCSKRDGRSAHTVCRSGTTTRGARRLSRSRASMHFSTPTGPPRLAGRFWKQPDVACGELR